jgi:hypothetical protein
MKPEIGQHVTVRGVRCEIVVVHKFGTIDVVSLCGNYTWRVSGLEVWS